MHKRGQNWSVEMIITSALFMTFFVIFLTFSFVSPDNDLRRVEYISDDLAAKLLSQGFTGGILSSNSEIDKSKLIEISELSYEQLQDMYGLSEDFCIILVDSSGDIIVVNGKYGIGSDNIAINSVSCGEDA